MNDNNKNDRRNFSPDGPRKILTKIPRILNDEFSSSENRSKGYLLYRYDCNDKYYDT